jgi:hypothetical protein
MKLIYLPCAQFKERWTEFVSGPNGIFERQVRALGVEIIPIRPFDQVFTIKTGQVLDPIAMTKWAAAQVSAVIQMLIHGEITSDDVIYFEDFWTPCMEMIPYTCDLVGKHPRLYAFNHAQSVDPNDFTYKMRRWMRAFEQAWADCLLAIFCADESLIRMMDVGWPRCQAVLYPTGTVFDHDIIKDVVHYHPHGKEKRQKRVVFSSRWDTEKRPEFFCSLAGLVYSERTDIDFIVCTGADVLRSDDPKLLRLLITPDRPNNLRVCEGLSKAEYYSYLATSKVQFNCADQDFVSYTLLEAATFGCAPLYPNYLSFPRALENNPKHLYKKGNLEDAKTKLYALIDSPSEDYSWVYQKYESSVNRMLYRMGFDVPEVNL